MTKRNLILIHRGAEYANDFNEIAARVRALDPEISCYILPSGLRAELPVDAWQNPTLTVSLVSKFRLPIRRGPVLKNGSIDKLIQQDLFRRNGIPTPPALPFQIGMTLDPILFGEFVILKPRDLTVTSTGEGVNLYRRSRLEKLTLADFPPNHFLHRNPKGYLVQRFIDTGERISAYRVTTFFSHPILSVYMKSNVDRPPLDAPDAVLESAPVANNAVKDKMRYIHGEDDMVELARKVHGLLPEVPLLGVDLLREAATGRLYVLECNAGGNTWHFSSKSGEKLRGWFGGHPRVPLEKAAQKGRQMYIAQYGVFDVAARVLVEKTRELAG